MMVVTTIAPVDVQVRELPRGWDIGGGEGLVGKGCDAPLWIRDWGLVFSDVGHSRWLLWRPGESIVSLVQSPTSKAMGTARDGEGRVIACEYDSRRVTRLELDGSITVLAGGEDDPLAGPDDVAIGPDGSVWFTDLHPTFPPMPEAPPSAICRVASGGSGAERVVNSITEPGGLAFSPDGSTLYVSDMTTRTLHAVDPATGEVRQLATITGDAETMPQGLAVDEHGNLYCGGPGGVWVTAPAGTHVGVIAHPASSTTNLAFGGPDGRTLFFTTNVAVGYVELAVRGAALPGDSATRRPVTWGDAPPLSTAHRIERLDPRMDDIIAPGTEVEELGSGGVFDDLGGGPHGKYARALEGTVWDAEAGYLFLSDIGNDRRLKWAPGEGFSVLHPHTHHANGATLDNTGAIVSCEQSGRRVSSLARSGEYTILADTCDGKQLGRPNDVVVRSDGNIYFTNPIWNFGTDDVFELPYPAWCHLGLDGTVTMGPPGFVVPNGLAFTPNEEVLYVNDSLGPNIKAYDVAADGTVDIASERVFFQFVAEGLGIPDGMKVDTEGNVYCGGPGGLWVISPDGKHLGTIVHGAAQVNNIAFGGPDWKTLYFVSWSAVFRIQLQIAGVPVPRRSMRS